MVKATYDLSNFAETEDCDDGVWGQTLSRWLETATYYAIFGGVLDLCKYLFRLAILLERVITKPSHQTSIQSIDDIKWHCENVFNWIKSYSSHFILVSPEK
jgi:hypothetical protein